MSFTAGSLAPEFTLQDERGVTHKLSQYRGQKNVVLIFYPGDDTPGCVLQLCRVRDEIQEFQKRQTVVYGVNQAAADSHRKFMDKYHLATPLLVDLGRAVAKLYGAIGKFIGHETTKRTVVIIDRTGHIRYHQQGMPEHSELFQVLDWLNNVQDQVKKAEAIA